MKPKLILADVSGPDAAKQMAAMYKAITGRQPTPEEMKKAEAAVGGGITVKPKKGP
jgi:hypothetical protein